LAFRTAVFPTSARALRSKQARDTRLGRDVALKVLPVSRHADPDQRARFEREAQTLAALSHPRIAAIYDIVAADGHNAIVMELVSGLTLADVLARGPVPLRAALSHAIDIADALAGAHAIGIVPIAAVDALQIVCEHSRRRAPLMLNQCC
jgi:serine/threonine protein kinase